VSRRTCLPSRSAPVEGTTPERAAFRGRSDSGGWGRSFRYQQWVYERLPKVHFAKKKRPQRGASWCRTLEVPAPVNTFMYPATRTAVPRESSILLRCRPQRHTPKSAEDPAHCQWVGFFALALPRRRLFRTCERLHSKPMWTLTHPEKSALLVCCGYAADSEDAG
jgi:hypothetical protein